MNGFIITLILSGMFCLTSAAALAQTEGKKPADSGAKTDSPPKATPDSKDSASDDEAHRPPPISGTWILPDQHDRGVTFETKLSFFRSQQDNVYTVHESVLCSRGLQSLASQAEAPIKATKNQITILEAANHEQKDGDITCEATIRPGTLHYTISADGKTLLLSVPGQPPMTLTREED